MSLKGGAFLIMWHDIAAAAEAEYSEWHTRQHMPQRLGHPGFLRGRRGVNRTLARQHWFTLYEGEGFDAFRSPAYLRSLNNPTEWTRRMQPHFRNFLRVSCAPVASAGRGVGAALATWRCDVVDRSAAEAARDLAARVEALLALPGVSSVHVGVARPEASSIPTSETALRPVMQERSFDLVVIAEGIGRGELRRAEPAMTAQLGSVAGLRPQGADLYELAYLLEQDEGHDPDDEQPKAGGGVA